MDRDHAGRMSARDRRESWSEPAIKDPMRTVPGQTLTRQWLLKGLSLGSPGLEGNETRTKAGEHGREGHI